MLSTALYAAISGMTAAQKEIDIIANNVANIRTSGFQKTRIETADQPYICYQKEGVSESADTGIRPVGTYIGLGAQVVGAYRIVTRGNFERTDQRLDVAISGAGYFAVNLPNNKIGYTKNGSFQLNADGDIVTNEGYTLVDAINIGTTPVRSLTISGDGRVTAPDPNDSTKILNFNSLQIYNFINDRGLEPLGSSFLGETVASGVAQAQVPGQNGAGALVQGSREESNVDPTTELTQLLMAQRAYEQNSKVIKVVAENEKTITDLKQ